MGVFAQLSDKIIWKSLVNIMDQTKSSKFSLKNFELGVRFFLPLVVHIMNLKIINLLVNVVMIEPDFGTIVFETACSLYLQKFDSLIVHEIYLAETKIFRMIQEVIINTVFFLGKFNFLN